MELYQFDLKNLTQKTYIQSISSDFSQSSEKPLIVQTLVWIINYCYDLSNISNIRAVTIQIKFSSEMMEHLIRILFNV